LQDSKRIRNKDIQSIIFLILSGIFLGSITLLNVLGTSKFIDYSFEIFNLKIPFVIAIGVLPYPITFLCTDLISELYGKTKANWVVWMGLGINLWVLFFVWLAGALDAPDEIINNQPLYSIENNQVFIHSQYAFYFIRNLTMGATLASMVAYLSAQFIDVQIFHYLKEKTQGRRLWLRNNASTIVSQLIDSIAVILITHYLVDGLPKNTNGELTHSLLHFVLSGYLFKLVIALLDTIPFYYLTKKLKKYF
tara:strand:+ start:15678 stop:16427 length:750 start_codon:yes stop_codon:yes gene_type:complete